MADIRREKLLADIRDRMQTAGIDALFIGCNDPHQSESVSPHWKTVQWLTGFTGSTGFAAVTQKEAAFWTDGRYREQSLREIDGTLFQIENTSVPESPSRAAWLDARLPGKAVVAADGEVLSEADAERLCAELARHDVTLVTDIGSILALWHDRPDLPSDSLWELPDTYAVESRREKLARVRAELPPKSAALVNCLDDVIWLTNLRGNDNPLYPFFHAYALITEDRAVLAADPARIPPATAEEMGRDGWTIVPYTGIADALRTLSAGTALIADPEKTALGLVRSLPSGLRRLRLPEPVTAVKAIRSPGEIENIRQANLLESAAVVRLMIWLEQTVGRRPLTEWGVGQKLNEFRHRSPLYLQPANIPIVGFGANAALPHYRPTRETAAPIKAEGFLLFDVCAQYLCGSTDLTRTVAVGPVTDAMKDDYTAVLKAHITLATQLFPVGTTGNLIDAVVKAGLWRSRITFRHGTGHGIGYVSNIHEGPGKISAEYSPAFPYAEKTPLAAGMVFSNEPGIYRPGIRGIRLENAVIVREAGGGEFGDFLGFETLTFLPFELSAVRIESLTDEERHWLERYHGEVRGKLRPLLSDEENVWLEGKTRLPK